MFVIINGEIYAIDGNDEEWDRAEAAFEKHGECSIWDGQPWDLEARRLSVLIEDRAH